MHACDGASADMLWIVAIAWTPRRGYNEGLRELVVSWKPATDLRETEVSNPVAYTGEWNAQL